MQLLPLKTVTLSKLSLITGNLSSFSGALIPDHSEEYARHAIILSAFSFLWVWVIIFLLIPSNGM